jgi:CYTH domain-containing protein
LLTTGRFRTLRGMKQEIERKFLVHAARVPASVRREGARLSQGYLAFQPSVRVRRSEREHEAPRAWLTIKGPGLLAREEYEYEIPADDAPGLLALCAATLTKIRYRVPVGAHVWELDEFTGAHAGLWLAEIELPRPDEPFEQPEWLDHEVTDDARYTNGALARAGRAP